MTREEAIQVLADFYVSTKNPRANHLCEAVYIAIQALKAELIKHGVIELTYEEYGELCSYALAYEARRRCKDCVHWEKDGMNYRYGWCEVYEVMKFENGYCDEAMGESTISQVKERSNSNGSEEVGEVNKGE